MSHADELVAKLVLTIFKRDTDSVSNWSDARQHLVECDSTRVEQPEVTDGLYGCDSGCDWVDLEAVMKCDHDEDGIRYVYGDFGSMDGLIYQLERMETEGYEPWAF